MDLSDHLREFDERGYTIVRGLFGTAIVNGVREEAAAIVEEQAQRLIAEGRHVDSFPDEPFETRLFRLYERRLDDAPVLFRGDVLHREAFYPLFFAPRLLDIVERLLGPEIRLYPNYSMRPKLPDFAGTEVLWHQDGGYTLAPDRAADEVAALRMVNVWTPLVPARVENGCMEFVPGTHRLGVVPHMQRRYYLEIERETLDLHVAGAVPIEVDPGDAVLFHNLLFHRGTPNRSGTIRWSLDWRYQDATQPTLRPLDGHIARSRSNPERAVRSAEEWAALHFV